MLESKKKKSRGIGCGILQNIKKELNANIALEIVIEMKKNQIPALVIDEKIIKFVRDIGGYIDVDMYII